MKAKEKIKEYRLGREITEPIVDLYEFHEYAFSPLKVKEKLFNQFKKEMKILEAPIIAIETSSKNIPVYIVSEVLGVKVNISADEYFLPNELAEDVEAMSFEQKREYYTEKLKKRIRSRVSFIVDKVVKPTDDRIFLLGSHLKAAFIKQQLHFNNPESEYAVNEEDTVICNVLQVNEKGTVCEVCGTVAKIDNGRMSAKYFVDDARRYFCVGDKVKATVKAINHLEYGLISLNVSPAKYDYKVMKLNAAKVHTGSWYSGTVVGYSPANKMYTIALEVEAFAYLKEDNVLNHEYLELGDYVGVQIIRNQNGQPEAKGQAIGYRKSYVSRNQ